MQYILCAFIFCVGIYLLAVSDEISFRRVGLELFGSDTAGVVIGILCIVVLLIYPVYIIFTNQSYCEVYENAVTGKTKLELKDFIRFDIRKMQTFDLTYEEILNVTEASQSLTIQTQYAAYEVLALTNHTDALNEIRRRMIGKK